MATNKFQFERHEILHGLLTHNQLTRTELLEALNSKLEAKIDVTVNWKTLHNDLRFLHEHGAKIHRPCKGDNRYYYEEIFHLYGTILNDEELNTLKTGIELLRCLGLMNIGEEFDEIIRNQHGLRYILPEESEKFMEFEQQTLVEGLVHLGSMVEAIQSQTALFVSYKPYYMDPMQIHFHPYLLKQYRNRWFVFGWNQENEKLFTLALDRILRIKISEEPFHVNVIFKPEEYFKHLIGVTWPENAKPETIRLEIDKLTAPYILSKKIHPTQRLIRHHEDGCITVELEVVVNYELKSVLLGFGSGVKVLKPEFLRQDLKKTYQACIQLYTEYP